MGRKRELKGEKKGRCGGIDRGRGSDERVGREGGQAEESPDIAGRCCCCLFWAFPSPCFSCLGVELCSESRNKDESGSDGRGHGALAPLLAVDVVLI